MDTLSTRLIQFKMFGAFKIIIGDKVISENVWKSKKSLLVLKYLLTKSGTKIAKEFLLDLFWPEENSSIHNLHVAIHNIRKTIKESFQEDYTFIYYSKGYYWLDDGICTIDCVLFEELYKKGRKVEKFDKEKALNIYQKAIEIYKDEFLSDDIYEDWTMEVRQHFKDLFVEMIIRTAEVLVEWYNKHGEAICLCKKALKHEPYQQELYEILISSLLKTGKSVEAIKIYLKYKKLMKEEFGLDFTDDCYYLFKDVIPDKEIGVLSKNESTDGPFLCDRKFFELLHLLESRRYNRYREAFSLIILNIKSKLLNEIKQYIIHICSRKLREVDIVCQWDTNTIIIKLYKANKKECNAVEQRLIDTFSEKLSSSLELKTFSVEDIKNLEDFYSIID
ncbi:MAG: BTAD domain-containing putative transcriptional regulator [Halanaerobiales bacterium]